jgi:hypothetical protein
MRLNRILTGALFFIVRAPAVGITAVLWTAMPVAAQEWTEYQNIQDGFKVVSGSAEGDDDVEIGVRLRASGARVQRGERQGVLPVTIADYGGIEQQGIARRKACPPGAGGRGRGAGDGN